MTRIIALAGLLAAGLLLQPILPAAAQDTPRAEASRARVLAELPADVTTEHRLALAGGALVYQATAGTQPVQDAKGEVLGTIFYVAYRVPATAGAPPRPVTFVFNGGPGAASAYLHLGAIGPRVIRFPADGSMPLPPVERVDNPDTWLAFTDLVFVDPIGTGYSRAADPGDEAGKHFYGVRPDLDVLAAFIRLWLARADRMGSPLFLAGESYGGLRAAALPLLLQNERGLAPAGVIMISPVLEFSLITEDPYRLLPWAVKLPSYAAAALEASGRPQAEWPAALAEAERFALGDYLAGLAAGPRDPEAADRLYRTVARLTGLPPELVARHRGRVPLSVFVKEFRRDEKRLSSRYDATVTGADPYPASPQARGGDPVLRPSIATFTTAFVGYARDELGWRTDRDYRVLPNEPSRRWDWRSGIEGAQGFVGVTDDLREGMAMNSRMRVLLVHGYTDLITPYLASRFVLDAMPPVAGRPPVEFRVYPGGHMMYSRPESRRLLAEDAAALYRPSGP